jgi:8-oxo-dGTP pyrophosphatase MutT (NUDIX family)
MGRLQRPVASVIAVRHSSSDPLLLLQVRRKPHDDTPYGGYLELPQGKIKKGESLRAAVARELREETGLVVSGYLVGGETPCDVGTQQSVITTAKPLVCVIDSRQTTSGWRLWSRL